MSLYADNSAFFSYVEYEGIEISFKITQHDLMLNDVTGPKSKLFIMYTVQTS